MEQQCIVHIVSHTHWDREWYLPKEHFQLLFHRFMDQLLDLMERNPSYKKFMLDGQTIALEDHLAVHPEHEGRIAALVQAGRLVIGPWFVLPDELLASGEAHIRNYLLGQESCSRFGPSMRHGYLPDSFGHPSQMPQILSGLGLRDIVFWRGVGPNVRQSEFTWRGMDGSTLLAVNLPFSYGVGACLPEDPEAFVQRVGEKTRALSKWTSTGVLLLMNGVDHVGPQPFLPRNLRALQQGMQECRFQHSTLDDYVADLESTSPELPAVSGELRSGYSNYLLAGTLSTRMDIKQAHHQAEQLTERWAEPFSAFAWVVGCMAYPDAELRRLWRMVLENLPHDSICGCSVDAVHEEMHARYALIRQVAESLRDTAFQAIAQLVPVQRHLLFIWNPLWFPRSEVVTLALDVNPRLLRRVDFQNGELVEHDPGQPNEAEPSIAITDAGGRPVPAQVVAAEERDVMRLTLHTQPEMYRVTRLTVEVDARNVPAMGYACYTYEPASVPRTRVANKALRLENEYLVVEPELATGAFTITNKEDGAVYRGIAALRDGGDAGDEYNYSPPPLDRFVVAADDGVTAAQGKESTLRRSLVLRYTLHVPEAVDRESGSRSPTTVECPVEVEASLTKGARRVELTVRFTNNARDHRLRLLAPTGIAAGRSTAEGTFSLEQRDSGPFDPADYEDWVEPPTGMHPTKSFVDVSDGARGLAMVTRGLPEFEVYRDADQDIIAITLLRSVGWLSRPDLLLRDGNGGWTLATPGAQCLGTHTFHVAIVPHAEKPDYPAIHREAHAFVTPMRGVQRLEVDVTPGACPDRALPASLSLVQADDDRVVLTAVKRSEDGEWLVVRLLNQSDVSVSTSVRFPFALADVQSARLDESMERQLQSPEHGRVVLSFGPWRIQTLKVKPAAAPNGPRPVPVLHQESEPF